MTVSENKTEEGNKEPSLPEGLSKSKEELEDKLRAADIRLHPAGGLAPDFVYEPIDVNIYIYKTKDGKAATTNVHIEYEDQEKQKGRTFWFIVVEGTPYYFTRQPPQDWLFTMPERATVEKWLHGEKKSLQTQNLWKLNGVYLRTFLDFPHEHEFNLVLLFIKQSWLVEILPVVFYLGVKGEYGGGKTVTGETITYACRHGYLTGNLSPPFIGRAIQDQKIMLMVDELDSIAGTKDSDLNSIFRQGYRRGLKYSRVNPETLQPESYLVFGPKIFTVHTEIEEALQTRTIPTHIRETGDPAYPVVGSDKESFARQVYTENFLWYMDHALNLRDNEMHLMSDSTVLLDILDALDLKLEALEVLDHSSRIREELFTRKKALLTSSQVSQVSQVAGRNVELMYLCFVLSNTIGINIDTDIKAAFDQKLIEEGERGEVGFLGILKEVLTALWIDKKELEAYKTEDGSVKISNKEIYDTYNEKMKKANGEGISPTKFKEYMLSFGFTDSLNRKKLEVPLPGDSKPKSRLCNIFTDRVLRKLDNPDKVEDNGLNELASKTLKLEPLKEPCHGECAGCRNTGSLDFQATLHDQTWALLCDSCGLKLSKRLNQA